MTPPVGGHGVLIAGGGLAAQRCCETLRASGYDGRVRMVCAERHAPYDRPPLSKGLLAGDVVPAQLALRPHGWHAEHGVELALGERAAGLDPGRRELILAGGERLGYDELLIATGARPRRLGALCEAPAGAAGTPLRPGVHELRTVDDALALRDALASGARLAVIGAGFVGLEVAATARRLGAAVTLIEADPLPLVRVLGERVGGLLARMHREEGVDLRLGAPVTAVRGAGRVEELVLPGGARVACDAALGAVGVAPDTSWLRSAGLPADGVPVGEAGAASPLPHVWAAGDVARAYDPVLQRHVGGDHWESAGRQGADAALGMLGRAPRAPMPSSFWSDQYGVRLQCVGRPALADRVVVRGDPDARDVAADFLRDGRLVGGLLVGRPRALAELRRRLAAAGPPTLKARSAA